MCILQLHVHNHTCPPQSHVQEETTSHTHSRRTAGTNAITVTTPVLCAPTENSTTGGATHHNEKVST